MVMMLHMPIKEDMRMGKYVKEGIDKWDYDHPYYCFNNNNFGTTFMEASVTYPFVETNKYYSEKEMTHMKYIWHSLICGQWYAAGNSICIALEHGDISKYNILRIAKLMLLYSQPWSSRIGNILHVTVLRSLALACEDISYSDVAKKIWEKAVHITAEVISDQEKDKEKRIIKDGWSQYIEQLPQALREPLNVILSRIN